MIILFQPHSFTYSDGNVGLLQTLIVLDELAKCIGSSTWQYIIFMAWNAEVNNLMDTNIMYRFSQYKLKQSTSKKSYPGQGKFGMHLSSFSTIIELALTV